MPSIHGLSPAELAYDGSATALREVWLAVSASLLSVLEHITLAQVASGELPLDVTRSLIAPRV